MDRLWQFRHRHHRCWTYHFRHRRAHWFRSCRCRRKAPHLPSPFERQEALCSLEWSEQTPAKRRSLVEEAPDSLTMKMIATVPRDPCDCGVVCIRKIIACESRIHIHESFFSHIVSRRTLFLQKSCLECDIVPSRCCSNMTRVRER